MASVLDDLQLGSAGVIDLLSGAASRATGGFLPQSFLAAQVWAEQEASAKGLTTQQQTQLQAVATRATQQGALNVAAAQTVEQVRDKVDTGLTTALRYAKYAIPAAAGVGLVAVAVKVYRELNRQLS